MAALFAVQDVDPWAIGPLVRAISPAGVAAFLAVSLVALLLRAWRYWVLLECAHRSIVNARIGRT